MSSLVTKVTQLEAARVELASAQAKVSRLENELATELHLPRKRGGARFAAPGDRRTRSVITLDMVREIKQRITDGESLEKVAGDLGISVSAVRRHAQGIKQNRKRIPLAPEIIAAIKAGPNKGETAAEHIKRIGLPDKARSAYYYHREPTKKS